MVKKNSFLWVVLIVLLVAFIGFVQVSEHEFVHGAVCRGIGGFEYYLVDWTTAYTGCRVADDNQFYVSMSDFTKFNLVNEIVGYNLSAIFVLVLLFPFYNKIIKEW